MIQWLRPTRQTTQIAIIFWTSLTWIIIKAKYKILAPMTFSAAEWITTLGWLTLINLGRAIIFLIKTLECQPITQIIFSMQRDRRHNTLLMEWWWAAAAVEAWHHQRTTYSIKWEEWWHRRSTRIWLCLLTILNLILRDFNSFGCSYQLDVEVKQ